MGERIEVASTPDSRTRDGVAPRGPHELVHFVQEVLDTLDGMLDEPIEERLTVVARGAAQCMGAALWRVSRVDSEVLRVRRVEVVRLLVPSARPERVGDEMAHHVAERPAVADAVEGSAFSVTLDTGDAEERRALRAIGFTSAVAAGGYDPEARRWLVELVGDEFAYETDAFTAILFSLVQAALGFPRAVTPTRPIG